MAVQRLAPFFGTHAQHHLVGVNAISAVRHQMGALENLKNKRFKAKFLKRFLKRFLKHSF
ncbi:hypothetical protein HPTD01_3573 [Halomonas sp. TD01]|nr:hypothetical protein HPTD01_3573 [Halomonas sp. TD01]